MPVLDHFGWIAPFYDQVIHPQQPEKLIQLLDLPSSDLLLDAGGGTGRVAQMLVGMASAILVADASLGMLRQTRLKKGLSAIQMETEALAFPDHLFGRIMMIDALHHVADQKKTATELLRVLKPGGKLVIEEPDIRTMGVRVMALFEKLALMRSHFISPQKIARLFLAKEAHTKIAWEGYSAWVIIEKLPFHGNE